MNIKLGEFLKNVDAEDFFFLNITRGNVTLYYGFVDVNGEIDEALYDLIIDKIYIDWPSTALGITVK